MTTAKKQGTPALVFHPTPWASVPRGAKNDLPC
jgi:hypothetical protein